MEKISTIAIEKFHKKIWEWYKINKRELPWRETKNPYLIHVSEIMLQQTQVSRVRDYYKRFLEKAPDLKSLSNLDKKTLLELWQGLGYNNRALRLQKSAREIIDIYGGEYPQAQEELLKLSGIGSYTSSAILAFAFEKRVGVVDTNIRRILILEFNLHEDISDKELQEIAYVSCPQKNVKEWYNALMDYGALELTSRKTQIKSRTKQSKFVGSTRWVRSQILKQVLQKEILVKATIEKEFSQFNIDIQKVFDSLIKDELIEIKDNSIYLHTK